MVATASNILATVFFGLAFLWFLIAVSYACSVVLFLRMRRDGHFSNTRIDDPEFGRYYMCGGRCYLPMGWIFRRFVLQYQNEQERRSNKGRVMDKKERRRAMETLLKDMKVAPKDLDLSADTSSSSSDSEPDEEVGCCDLSGELENVCSICLGNYTKARAAWTSPVCKHCFHRDCLLAWLEQPGKVECPCCREAIVDEDEVWNTVKNLRKHRPRESSKKTKKAKKDASSVDAVTDEEAPSSGNAPSNA